MLSEHVERAIMDRFETLEPGVYVSREGKTFRKPIPMRFVVPRVSAIERFKTSAGGPTEETWTVEVMVCTRNAIKGQALSEKLSRLVDTVRAVCDGEFPTTELAVDDGALPTPAVIGTVRWGPVDEERLRGQTIEVDGTELEGVDVSVLTVEAQVCGV